LTKLIKIWKASCLR